jgi:hypothetical protein
VAALARRGAALAAGLAEPLAATIAACREILAYVNRNALLGLNDDIGREVARLDALLDDAHAKLSAAVRRAEEAEEAAAMPEREPDGG